MKKVKTLIMVVTMGTVLQFGGCWNGVFTEVRDSAINAAGVFAGQTLTTFLEANLEVPGTA